jgi:tetratricopeptide (TPR) repeat protein
MYKIIGILGAVIIVIGLIWFIFSDIKINVSPNENTTAKDGVNTILSENNDKEDIEIRPIPIDNAIRQELIYPDLNRPIVFPDSFPEDARIIIQNNVAALTAQLKTDPDLFNSWLDLAIQYKIIEDYKGARDIWEFLSTVSPENSVSFRNLGDLYGYYLGDNQKAEKNLLRAIEISPNEIEYYLKTMEFYRDVMKDIVKARQIIEQGINSNPTSEELKCFLNNLSLQ